MKTWNLSLLGLGASCSWFFPGQARDWTLIVRHINNSFLVVEHQSVLILLLWLLNYTLMESLAFPFIKSSTTWKSQTLLQCGKTSISELVLVIPLGFYHSKDSPNTCVKMVYLEWRMRKRKNVEKPSSLVRGQRRKGKGFFWFSLAGRRVREFLSNFCSFAVFELWNVGW